VNRELKDVIRELREGLGLSQAQLGARAGVGQTGIGNIESGQTKNPIMLPEIAQALGTTVEAILTQTGRLKKRAAVTPLLPGRNPRWPFTVAWERYAALDDADRRDLDETVEDFIIRRENRKGGDGSAAGGAR
jgi:transcriptional regulator with XRE-family HTH domain